MINITKQKRWTILEKLFGAFDLSIKKKDVLLYIFFKDLFIYYLFI